MITARQSVGVVKDSESKSIKLCPQGFEPLAVVLALL
jgi:hypothetical protein